MKRLGEDILVVDVDAFSRHGIRCYLQSFGYTVLEASDVQSGWDSALKNPPQVAIVTVCLPSTTDGNRATPPGTNGIGLILRLKQIYPAMGLVVMSNSQLDEQEAYHLTQRYTNSIAFLHKGEKVTQLLYALEQVKNGRNLFQHNVMNKYAGETSVRNHMSKDETYWIDLALMELPLLSPREKEVADLLSTSHTAENIASLLGLTKGSIDNIISRIYHKLGLADMRKETPELRPLPILVKACLLNDIRHQQ